MNEVKKSQSDRDRPAPSVNESRLVLEHPSHILILLFGLGILALFSYPLIRDLYQEYEQIDLKSFKLFIVLSLLSAIVLCYFLSKKKLKRLRDKAIWTSLFFFLFSGITAVCILYFYPDMKVFLALLVVNVIWLLVYLFVIRKREKRSKRRQLWQIVTLASLSWSILLLLGTFCTTISLDPHDSSIYNSDIIVAEFNKIIEPSLALGIQSFEIPEAVNISEFIYANLQRLSIEFGFISQNEESPGIRIGRTKRRIKNEVEAKKILSEAGATSIIWGYSLLSLSENEFKIIFPMITYRKFHLLSISDEETDFYLPVRTDATGQYAPTIPIERIPVGDVISQYEPLVRPTGRRSADLSEMETWLIYMLTEVYLKHKAITKSSKDKKIYNINEAYLFEILAALHKEQNTQLNNTDTTKVIERIRTHIKRGITETIAMAIPEMRIPIDHNDPYNIYNYDWNWNYGMTKLQAVAPAGSPDVSALNEVILSFQRCLTIKPDDPRAENYLGMSLVIRRGRRDDTFESDSFKGIEHLVNAYESSKDVELRSAIFMNICNVWFGRVLEVHVERDSVQEQIGWNEGMQHLINSYASTADTTRRSRIFNNISGIWFEQFTQNERDRLDERIDWGEGIELLIHTYNDTTDKKTPQHKTLEFLNICDIFFGGFLDSNGKRDSLGNKIKWSEGMELLVKSYEDHASNDTTYMGRVFNNICSIWFEKLTQEERDSIDSQVPWGDGIHVLVETYKKSREQENIQNRLVRNICNLWNSDKLSRDERPTIENRIREAKIDLIDCQGLETTKK